MADITVKDLAAGTPSLTDLTIMANPTTGVAKKITFEQIGTVLQTAPIDTTGATDGDFAKWGPDGNIFFENVIIPNAVNPSPGFYTFMSVDESYVFESFGLKQAQNGGLILSDDNGNFAEIATSLLTLNSTTKGFLKPRLTTTQRNTISSPATGLEVFDTTLNLPYYYNGTAWTAVNGGGGLSTWGSITGTLSAQTDLQNALNGKQATLVSGTNIKTVNGNSLLGSGDIVIAGGTGLTSLNALTSSTQVFATSTTGTDFTISSATSTHTFNIPTASATARGLLSSASFTTFTNKQDALVSGTNIKTINGVTLLGSGNITTGTGNGTVTSVGLNVSIAAFTLTATANPITTSGTFTIAAAGDSTQYINGAGNLVTFPTFSSTSLVVKTVRNQTGATLAAGTVVYIDGASGNIATVQKADAAGDASSAQTFGVTQAAISNNSNGVIVLIGDVTDLNTAAYVDGTQLYLGTAGAMTATKPYAPTHLVYVAIVTRAHLTQGVITVKIQNGYELDELHNVSAQSPANNDSIFYNTTTSLWEKKSISTVLGFTPQAALTGTGFVKSTAGTISYDTSTYLTANQSITLSGDVSGSGTTAITATLATITQASSGNFVKVTLDTKGRVTGNTAVLAADIAALGFTSALITTNRQTASYTLVLTDANKLVELNVATANTLTIPLNSTVAFPIGTQILISQYGAGVTTLTATSGVTLRSESSKLKLNGQNAGATLIKIATDEWYAFGNLIA